jgi:hypothetical protein
MRVVAAKDYHRILGVHKGAPKDEIKRAYRRLALMYHPDRNRAPDAAERFREINEAYRVLSGMERPPAEPGPAEREAAWAASVINRWSEMASRKRDNMYR